MSRRVSRALNDQSLQTALARLMSLMKMGRQIAFAGVDFDALSQEIRRVKERAIVDLPHLAEEFKEKATRAGAIVYEAKNADEANAYILNLAQRKDIRQIVKSKSMLCEEIGLREYLEKAGIEVTETDIGEWIIQLAGERPAHLVGPALHKTIEQVAELFSRATGQRLEPEPQLLLDTARNALRQHYIDARMGISGANMAIAETGTLAIVTNEGNGCMTTTLPPVHVAVVGYEKIIPTWEDTATILRLLSRCTNGMKMPVYVSYITGPSHISAPFGKTATATGPAELHIVMVDNGRWEMWHSPEFREALYCIKCGACLNVCPVFNSLAGQTYGYIYQGGIGAVLTAFFHGLDKARDPASLCLGCMACKEACPARIDIPQLVLRLKAAIAKKRGLPWADRLIYSTFLKHPQRLDAAMKAVYYIEKQFADPDKTVRHLPPPLDELTNAISLPLLSTSPLHQQLAHIARPGNTKQPKVALYAGCIGNYVYPETCVQAVKVLQKLGVDVYFPPGQGCCGAPAYFSGDIATTLSLAKTNITALEEDPDYIVTLCPGCAVMLKQNYTLITKSDQELNQHAEALAAKVRDFSQLVLQLTPVTTETPTKQKVTYHDPCHLKRGLGIASEPRQLLRHYGFEIVEMADADACCGFGGRVVLDYPRLSASVLKRKLDSIEASGTETVVTSCLPCVLQLRGGLDKRHSPIKVLHIAELLANH
jgi:iron-sulfur cluster protein